MVFLVILGRKADLNSFVARRLDRSDHSGSTKLPSPWLRVDTNPASITTGASPLESSLCVSSLKKGGCQSMNALHLRDVVWLRLADNSMRLADMELMKAEACHVPGCWNLEECRRRLVGDNGLGKSTHTPSVRSRTKGDASKRFGARRQAQL